VKRLSTSPWPALLLVACLGCGQGFAARFRAVGNTDENRTWRSKRGLAVEARLLGVEGSTVILHKRSGFKVRIARTRLSAEDQAYLEKATAQQP